MSSRHSTKHRVAAVGVSIAGLIGVAALGGVVGGQAASATTPSYPNIVTLQTGSSNVVTEYTSTGSVSRTQKLSSKSNNCTATWAGQPEIVKLGVAGVAGRVAGLRSGSIGVVDKLTGESCAQVNAPGESLELLLPAAMSSAVLDIEVQKDAVVTATLSYNGGNTVTRTLRSGQAAVGATGDFFACRPGATSSAPNSGPADNCRWFIGSALFNKVVLTAEQGQFALEGGSDGAVPLNPAEPTGASFPTSMTYFAKASGLDCNAPVTLTGTGMIPTVTITRVNDLDTTCGLIPYSLTGAGGSFTFNKPVGDALSQFYIDAAWKAAVGTPVKKTTVDYLLGNPEVELDWCPSVVYAANGGPLNTTQAVALPDQDSASTSKEFACILSSNSSVPVSGIITISQRIYLLGDPIMRG